MLFFNNRYSPNQNIKIQYREGPPSCPITKWRGMQETGVFSQVMVEQPQI